MRPLSLLKENEEGVIKKIENNQLIKRRLIEIGIVPSKKIKVISIAPLGDPVKVDIEGFEVSLRKQEADIIYVE